MFSDVRLAKIQRATGFRRTRRLENTILAIVDSKLWYRMIMEAVEVIQSHRKLSLYRCIMSRVATELTVSEVKEVDTVRTTHFLHANKIHTIPDTIPHKTSTP
eukprot:scaffold8333_cov159-Amphora_coffeaeformis.AAC.2